ADDQLAAARAGPVVGILFGAPRRGDDVEAVSGEWLAEIGQLGTPRRAANEASADARFELLDAFRQRRLGQAELVRGKAEGAGFGNGSEMDELSRRVSHLS